MKRSTLLLLPALLSTACVVNGDTGGDPCDPNPCTQANRTVCVPEAEEARCLCNEGFIARPGGACEAVGPSNCAQHSGDAAEPDDCTASARPLSPGGPALQQTVDPIGDYDFFLFNATGRNVYRVSVVASAPLMPRVDLFDQAGEWLTAAESPNRTDLYFKARVTSPLYARVSHSPLDASVAVGAYSLTFTSLGQEDHGDLPDEATSLTPDPDGDPSPTTLTGNFDYPNDEDWFAFSGNPDRRYELSFDPNRTVPTVAVFAGGNFQQPVLTGRNATVNFTLPTSGTAFIVLYAPADGPGSYAFRVFEW